MMSRKWAWTGHTLKRSKDCIGRQALGWKPQGSRRRGRPCNSWRRDRPHHPDERSLLAPARTPVQGQRGLEGLYQWPMFRDGMIKASDSDQIRCLPGTKRGKRLTNGILQHVGESGVTVWYVRALL